MRRLLGYMSGLRRTVVLVIVFTVLNALLTVGTVSMIKPMLDLLFKGRLVDTRHLATSAQHEIGRVVTLGDGTVAAAVAGNFATRKAADDLRGTLERMTDTAGTTAVLDLRNASPIGERAWAELLLATPESAPRRAPLYVLLPDDVGATSTVAAAAGHSVTIVRASGASLPSAPAAVLDAVKTVVPPEIMPLAAGGGFLDKLKASALEFARPAIEYVERKSASDLFTVLGIIVGIMLTMALLMTLTSFAVGYLSSYLGNKVVQRLRQHLYGHLMGQDVNYFQKHSTGGLMSVVMQDVNAVESTIEILFSNALRTPITIITFIVAMLILSPALTGLVFFVMPAVGLLMYVLGRRMRKASGRIQGYRAGLSSLAQETFAGMRVVKAYNMERPEAERFEHENQKLLRMSMRTVSVEELGTALIAFLGFVALGTVILAGGYYVLATSSMSPSAFILFIGFLTQVFRPLKGMSKVAGRVQKGLAGCDRVFAVIDTPAVVVDRDHAKPVSALREAIVFENVTFGYGEGRDAILRDVNLRVPAGQVVAFVGETGSGKTTLVSLLPRFFDPTSGCVTYDGTDLRDLQIHGLRDQIALISQDVVLFDATVTENIRYGCPRTVTQQDIEAAAVAANAHKFITTKLSEGYETRVGTRGGRLSGGERQRIAIARAILKDAPILILDEATSALDSETEALIQDALDQLMVGRTVFIIAHRLSTIQRSDVICVLDGGRIVESGSHSELLAAGGRYARYHAIQFGTTETPS